MEQLSRNLTVRDVYTRIIMDCSGQPAIETEVLAGDYIVGRVSLPGELTYGNDARRAADYVNSCLAGKIAGMNVFDQTGIDSCLSDQSDEQEMKMFIRAALFSVSAASAAAAAAALRMPLYQYLGGVRAVHIPVPAVHLNGTVMIVPPSSGTFEEQIGICCDMSDKFRKLIKEVDSTMSWKEIRNESIIKDRNEFINSLNNPFQIKIGETITVTELSKVIEKMQKKGRTVVFSCCGRETADTLAADLAVAFGADWFEGGSFRHMENIEKYNRLFRISEKTGNS